MAASTENSADTDDASSPVPTCSENDIPRKNNIEEVDPEIQTMSSQLVLMEKELYESRERYRALVDSESKREAADKFEVSFHDNIVSWMKLCQTVLWPSNSEEVQRGKPTTDVAELPIAVMELSDKANSNGLSSTDDVNGILEHFSVIYWGFRSLLLIRAPPTCFSMRYILSKGKSLKFVDDRIFKFISNLLNRALAWKQKVKKLLHYETYESVDLSDCERPLKIIYVDSSKLVLTNQDGALIPFSTRLKPLLKMGIETTSKNLEESGNEKAAEAMLKFHSQDGEVDSTVEASKVDKPKRGPRHSIATLASIQAKISFSQSDISDDEDGNFWDSHSQLSVLVSDKQHMKIRFDKNIQRIEALQQRLADDTTSLWPIKLDIQPIDNDCH